MIFIAKPVPTFADHAPWPLQYRLIVVLMFLLAHAFSGKPVSIPALRGDRHCPDRALNRSLAAPAGEMRAAAASVGGNAEKSLREINDRRPIFTLRAQSLISSRFSHTLLTIIDKARMAAGGAAFWLHRGNGQSAVAVLNTL